MFSVVPILVFISSCTFAVLIARRLDIFFEAYDQLIIQLNSAALAWTLQQAISMPQQFTSQDLTFQAVNITFEKMRSETTLLIDVLRYSSLSWIIAGLFLALVGDLHLFPSHGYPRS